VTETPKRLYYGWIMLVAVVFVILAGSGIRAVFGVFIKPIEAEFGWSRAQLSGAAALSLFVLGADMQPLPVEINRLDNQVLVHYYESDWRRWE